MDWVLWIFCVSDSGWLGCGEQAVVSLPLWLLCLIGHLGIWCVVFNRIHATALSRKFRKQAEKVIVPIAVLPVVYVLTKMCFWFDTSFDSSIGVIKFYMFASVILSIYFIGRWIYRRFVIQQPAAIISSEQIWLDIRPRVPGPFFFGTIPKLLGSVPLNEVSKLTLQRMTLSVDIPEQLEGFKICQLSDLHLTGQIAVEYFQEIVKEANQFEPDVVLITGDLIDEEICLPWIGSVFGQLESKFGVYYVLGNHDMRIGDEAMLRQRIAEQEIIAVAGAWHEVDVNGAKVVITGNASPWFRDVDRLPSPAEQPESELAILLSHSPDQITWAQKYKFDLMFAGHTHGGQIAFPIIGPVVAPSKYGVTYAAGTFQIGSTLMHVSRGISGDEAIRINSPPELGLFTLTGRRT